MGSLFPTTSCRLVTIRVSFPLLRYTSAISAVWLTSSSLSSIDFMAILSTETCCNKVAKYKFHIKYHIYLYLLILSFEFSSFLCTDIYHRTKIKCITSIRFKAWPLCNNNSSTCGLRKLCSYWTWNIKLLTISLCSNLNLFCCFGNIGTNNYKSTSPFPGYSQVTRQKWSFRNDSNPSRNKTSCSAAQEALAFQFCL